MKRFGLFMVVLAVSAVGCGDSEDDHDDVTAAADACEHMADGPSEAVTAIDDATGDPPDTGEHHTRWDITLVALATDNGGYVDLVIDEGGEQTLFFDADVPVKLFDSAATEVAVEATDTNITECTEVVVGHTFDLAVGTYLLDIGPTTRTELSMVVIEESEEHGHLL